MQGPKLSKMHGDCNHKDCRKLGRCLRWNAKWQNQNIIMYLHSSYSGISKLLSGWAQWTNVYIHKRLERYSGAVTPFPL